MKVDSQKHNELHQKLFETVVIAKTILKISDFHFNNNKTARGNNPENFSLVVNSGNTPS